MRRTRKGSTAPWPTNVRISASSVREKGLPNLQPFLVRNVAQAAPGRKVPSPIVSDRDDSITVSNVSKVYRVFPLLPWKAPTQTEALRDVSFRCPRESITCLLGPNGSGKTTMIKIPAGRGPSAALDCPRRPSTALGITASGERSFYWRLTGRQNLDFFAALHTSEMTTFSRSRSHLVP